MGGGVNASIYIMFIIKKTVYLHSGCNVKAKPAAAKQQSSSAASSNAAKQHSNKAAKQQSKMQQSSSKAAKQQRAKMAAKQPSWCQDIKIPSRARPSTLLPSFPLVGHVD